MIPWRQRNNRKCMQLLATGPWQAPCLSPQRSVLSRLMSGYLPFVLALGTVYILTKEASIAALVFSLNVLAIYLLLS